MNFKENLQNIHGFLLFINSQHPGEPVLSCTTCVIMYYFTYSGRNAVCCECIPG